jgi:ATP-dependent RNA helicase DDX1
VPTTIGISVDDRDSSIAIGNDGLLVQCRLDAWAGARANTGALDPGRFYYEVEVRDEGLVRVGWSTKSARLEVGTDKWSFGFGGTGKKSNNKQFDTYGEPFTRGDVIGCYLVST